MKRRNLLFLLLIVVMIGAMAALLFAPVYSAHISLYTKKSSNTFPGDEKYLAALAEVQDVQQSYNYLGTDLKIEETQTLRETSKGTTSLMTFNVVTDVTLKGCQVLTSGLVPGWVLAALLCCFALTLVLMLSTLPAMKQNPDAVSAGVKTARKTACWFSFAGLLLVAVFAMCVTYYMNRAVLLWKEGTDVANVEAVLPLWGKLLLGDLDLETVRSILQNLSKGKLLPLWWFMLLPAAVCLFACLKLSFDHIGKVLSRAALYAAIIVICIFVLYPFYVMVITGFREPAETSDMKFLYLFPTKWVWSNISDIIDRDVLVFMKNSILLSTGATLLSMLCGIPAAYALSRMHFKGKKVFLGFVIMSQMFSPVVLLVGISKLMNVLNLTNSIVGLVFINAAFNQAFAIWLLRGTFSSISSEMEQAACIDGCGTVGALVRVLLPVAAPGIVTALIFVFINAWNEYTISTVLITNRLNKPITVGITEFSSYNMIEWQYLFAAAFLATIPVVILFILIEKHLVGGLTAGGVKG